VRTLERSRTRVVVSAAAVVVLGAALAALAWRSEPSPAVATVAGPSATAAAQPSATPRRTSAPALRPSPTASAIPLASGPYTDSTIGFFVSQDSEDPWSVVLHPGDAALVGPGTIGFGWPCGTTAYRDGCSDMAFVAPVRAGTELVVGTRSCLDITTNPFEAAICNAEGGQVPPATISGSDIETLEQAWRAAFVHEGPVSAEDGTVGGAGARILIQRHRLVAFVDTPRGIVVIEMSAGGLVADAVAARERRFRAFLERFRLLPAPEPVKRTWAGLTIDLPAGWQVQAGYALEAFPPAADGTVSPLPWRRFDIERVALPATISIQLGSQIGSVTVAGATFDALASDIGRRVPGAAGFAAQGRPIDGHRTVRSTATQADVVGPLVWLALIDAGDHVYLVTEYQIVDGMPDEALPDALLAGLSFAP
jgi:hypothetical protein